MKKIKIIYCCLLAFALFASCENDIEFKGEESDPMLVINGFIRADSTIRLHLSESRFFLESESSSFPVVKDAEVKLFVNGEERETLLFNSSGYGDYEPYLYYSSIYRPKEGDHIKIMASTPKFKNVSSSVSIPRAAPIASIDTLAYKLVEVMDTVRSGYYTLPKENQKEEWTYTLDTVGYYFYDDFAMKINIDDRGDEKNFYRINLSVRHYYQSGWIAETPVVYAKTADFDALHPANEYNSVFTTNDPVFNKNNSLEDDFLGNSEISRYFDFPDVLFNGKRYGLSLSAKIFKSYHSYDEWAHIDPIVRRELLVNLHSISEDYYYYIRSYAAHENNEKSIFMEPVQIHSNIDGGIGILATSSAFSYTFALPQ